MDDFETAEAHARAAVALAESRGGLPSQSEALRTLARVLVARGQGVAAVVIAERSLAISLKVDGSRAQLDKRLTLASARHAAGSLAEARGETEVVLAAARQQQDSVLSARHWNCCRASCWRRARALKRLPSDCATRRSMPAWRRRCESAGIADLITGLERDRQKAAIELLEKDNRIQALDLTRNRYEDRDRTRRNRGTGGDCGGSVLPARPLCRPGSRVDQRSPSETEARRARRCGLRTKRWSAAPPNWNMLPATMRSPACGIDMRSDGGWRVSWIGAGTVRSAR